MFLHHFSPQTCGRPADEAGANRKNTVKTYHIKATQEHNGFGSQQFCFFTAARCGPEASLQLCARRKLIHAFNSKWFIQKRLNSRVWVASNLIDVICDITGRTRTTGNSRTPRAKGNVILEVSKKVYACVFVCVRKLCRSPAVFLFYHAQVLFCWWEKLFWHRWEKQFIFVESSKSNFCVHRTVTIALIMTGSLLWRAPCWGRRMGEAGRRHLLDLWCQIAHPHHRYIFSSEYQNVNCRLYFFFFSSQIKNRVVFLGSAGFAECEARLLAKHYDWTDIIWGAGWWSWHCFFLPGPTRVTRRTRVTRGQGCYRRRQNGATGTSISASQCYIIVLQCFYLHILKSAMLLFL